MSTGNEALEGELRALRGELGRMRALHEQQARDRGALEVRLAEQAAELERRRLRLAEDAAALDAARADFDAAGRWTPYARHVWAHWQSHTVLGELRRQITGDPRRLPDLDVRDRFLPEPAPRAIALGGANAVLLAQLIDVALCTQVTAVDHSPARLDAARAGLSGERRDLVELVETPRGSLPTIPAVELVVVRGALNDVADVTGWAAAVTALVAPGGLLYIDDFVGPRGGVLTSAQVDIVQRLLDRLPDERKVDLVAGDGRLREVVDRPASAPTGRCQALIDALGERFAPLDVRPLGGAIYGPLFQRIMGNFAGNDELVRVLVETDAVLTDAGVVEPHHLWAVYRR